jgi:hypothetical protein
MFLSTVDLLDLTELHQMKFLTGIMGKTKRDRIRNAYIREELRMDTKNEIEGRRLKGFG